MTQVLSSSMSNVTTGSSPRSSGRSRSEDIAGSTGRFSDVLEQSTQTRTQADVSESQQFEKTAENKAKTVEQDTADEDNQVTDQVAASDEPTDDDGDQTADEIDANLAAVAIEQATPTPQQQDVTAVDTNAQQTVTANTDSTSPLLKESNQSQIKDTKASETSAPKGPKDVADAMLRMLGVSHGQSNNAHHATFTITDVAPPTLPINSTADQSSNQPQLQLPDSRSSESTDSANVGRVSRALSNAINQKGGTITIRMMPPELGQVRVDIQMQGGKVSASFQTEHQSVQSLMNRELSQLRQALEKQGLTVEKLEVTQKPAGSSNANASSQDNQQSPSDGRSRGQYARQNPQQSDRQSSNNTSGNFASQLVSQL